VTEKEDPNLHGKIKRMKYDQCIQLPQFQRVFRLTNLRNESKKIREEALYKTRQEEKLKLSLLYTLDLMRRGQIAYFISPGANALLSLITDLSYSGIPISESLP